MATLGSTQVSGNSANLQIPLSPFIVEIWRVTHGTVGDTATITPARGRFVVGAIGGPPSSTTLSTLGTDTNVVLTLTASGSTSVTSDVLLLLQQ